MDFILGLSGRIELECSTNEGAKNNVISIVCHPHPLHGGTMNNKVVTTVYKEFCRYCKVSIRFNYRGVGRSEGQYGDAEGELADLISVITWAKNEYGDMPLYLSGFSFGAYISLRASLVVQNLSKLLSIAPAVHHHDYNNLGEPECPWTIVIGSADELVPMDAFDKWYEEHARSAELNKLENASHFFHGRLIELKVIVNEFINK